MPELQLTEEDIGRIKEKLSGERKQLQEDEVELLEALLKKVDADNNKNIREEPGWIFNVWSYRF